MNKMQQQIYSVWQVNAYIHTKFEADPRLRLISIKGELSNVKYHSAGHIYFTLKDSKSAIAGVMFSSNRRGLSLQLKEGLEVVVSGSISSYERDGRYQIYAVKITATGAGELYERYERLRCELEEMGMFDASYKQSIPAFVKTLGVVTAPTGAAVRDIINVSKRRYPGVQIILYPAKVQGEGSAQSVCEGIQVLDQAGVDCIIVGRGGGAIEDLWAFNEECVARAIFECRTPIISGVGHETDTTIADWVADLRAPTPSAAAELAVFDYIAYQRRCKELKEALFQLMNRRLTAAKNKRMLLEKTLQTKNPGNNLKENRMRLIRLSDRLEGAIEKRLEREKQRLSGLSPRFDKAMNDKLSARKHALAVYAANLEGLSPLLKLSQGYSLTESEGGQVLSTVKRVKSGDNIKVHVRDGEIRARVTDTVYIDRG